MQNVRPALQHVGHNLDQWRIAKLQLSDADVGSAPGRIEVHEIDRIIQVTKIGDCIGVNGPELCTS